MNRLRALMLLQECTGDDIWSLEHCRLRQVPEEWIEELSDCFESGLSTIFKPSTLAKESPTSIAEFAMSILRRSLGDSLACPLIKLLLNPPPAALWLLPFKTLQKRCNATAYSQTCTLESPSLNRFSPRV